MTRFYCDYCDQYLTTNSPSGRKQHRFGRRHRELYKYFYEKIIKQKQDEAYIAQLVKGGMSRERAQASVNAAAAAAVVPPPFFNPRGAGFQPRPYVPRPYDPNYVPRPYVPRPYDPNYVPRPYVPRPYDPNYVPRPYVPRPYDPNYVPRPYVPRGEFRPYHQQQQQGGGGGEEGAAQSQFAPPNQY